MSDTHEQRPIRELRIHAALVVSVTWVDSEQRTKQTAYTIDVSRSGARLAGVRGIESAGLLVAIRRKASEAQFRVIWIGKPKTPQEGQVGVKCVDPDRIIWDVDFNKEHEDFVPIGTAIGIPTYMAKSPDTATNSAVYGCQGTVLVWSEGSLSGVGCRLTAIGLSGCGIENTGDLPSSSHLLLQVEVEETQLTFKGIRHEWNAVSGAWIEFTHIRRGDRRSLEALIICLSRRKEEER